MTRKFGMCAAAAFACIAAMSPSVGRAQAAAPGGSPPPEVVAVQKVVEGFIEALNAADIERFSAFFTPDATVFFPLAPMFLRLEDKEQVTKVFNVFFDSIRKRNTGPQYMRLVPQDLRVQIYKDTAIATFHFKGPDLISRRTLVLEREGGKWLVVHMHASGIEVPRE
ncbi:MAG: nuclear transport factor 2 family protein [Acidobacteriia bacterium]|nr:nuclear transport factor 2 family protein [Terriglobia bacterium]